tara:strand:- start:183 stop:380 length:198 start_codon:yes stop_codon:yes gene_type:complete
MIQSGVIPLGILAIIFAALQVWWISMTIFNARKAEQEAKNRRVVKLTKKDLLKEQKKYLERLLKE